MMRQSRLHSPLALRYAVAGHALHHITERYRAKCPTRAVLVISRWHEALEAYGWRAVWDAGADALVPSTAPGDVGYPQCRVQSVPFSDQRSLNTSFPRRWRL